MLHRALAKLPQVGARVGGDEEELCMLGQALADFPQGGTRGSAVWARSRQVSGVQLGAGCSRAFQGSLCLK